VEQVAVAVLIRQELAVAVEQVDYALQLLQLVVAEQPKLQFL
jgi:hypothetical protein